MGNTDWRDVIVRKLPDQCRHGLDVIVDALKQHGLVPYSHVRHVELLRSGRCDPRELVRVVEMSV